MTSSLNLSLMIIAEALFLAFLFLGFWSLILRQRLRDTQSILERLRIEKSKIQDSLFLLRSESVRLKKDKKSLQEQLKALKDHLVAQAAESNTLSQGKTGDGSNRSTLITSYQERIKNLQTFKDLYFQVEEKYQALTNSHSEASKTIEALQLDINERASHITKLRKDIQELTKKYQGETELREAIEKSLAELEASSENLKLDLENSQRKYSTAKGELEALEKYQTQAMQLEDKDRKLKRELIESRDRIKSLQAIKNTTQLGGVRVEEIESLSSKLRYKDDEIRKLRTECETIAYQYEELALQSLNLASQDKSLSKAKLAEMDSLRDQLQNSNIELELKRAECQMLEDYFLDLQDHQEIEQTTFEVENSLKDLEAMGDRHRELFSQIEEVCSDDISAELKKLREKLTQTEETLKDTRKDYSEIQEQFIELSKEDGELREINRKLKSEQEKLQREVASLRDKLLDKQDLREEFDKLQVEYAKMESRYLELVDK